MSRPPLFPPSPLFALLCRFSFASRRRSGTGSDEGDRARAGRFRGRTRRPPGAVQCKDVSFDEAWRRLKKRARPSGPLRTGRVDLPSSDHGIRLDNVLEVPPDYVPGRKWPLRVTLHGGVGRPAPRSR